MRTTKLASLELSEVGMGCNNFGRALDADGTAAVVGAALDEGITFFDCADVYGGGQSEGFLGRALGSRRDEAVVATKFGIDLPGVLDGGASPAYVRSAITDSLRRLGMGHVDLYYLHRPDEKTPIGDTLGAMNELVSEGLVREIACSNLTAEQMIEADTVARDQGVARFVTTQVEYSLVHREPQTNGVLDACRRTEMALVPYYPLASGLLTGKVRRGQTPEGRLTMERYQHYLTDENFDLVERLEAVASQLDRTLLELAFGWLLAQPEIPSVIAGATKPEQVRSNAAAAARPLTPDEVDAIDAALT
jgi:aryl-alcohol dehydrogenase-like predicted oxidoreductase